MCVMAIPVVEFSREGYKIRKVFGLNDTNLGAHFLLLIFFDDINF